MPSSATAIRDAILARVSQMGIDPDDPTTKSIWKTVGKNPAGTLHPPQLPFVGVFLLRERRDADGDNNQGALAFVHEATIGVSVALRGGDTGKIDDDWDALTDQILGLLLTDPAFTSLGDGALFESIEGIERTRLFPAQGETFFAEGRVEITFRFRTVWHALTPDDLLLIHGLTRPILHPNSPPIDRRWTLPAPE